MLLFMLEYFFLISFVTKNIVTFWPLCSQVYIYVLFESLPSTMNIDVVILLY